MYHVKSIISMLLMLNLISCHKKDLIVGMGEEITLNFGDTGIIRDKDNELGIEFTQLTDDSLCPENAHCIWAGRAVVQILVNKNEVFTLGIGDLITATPTPFVNSIDYLNYKITLLDVEHSGLAGTGKAKNYRITLRVDQR